MATHRISMLGFQALPDATGDVFFEPYSVKAANDRWPYLVLVFNNGAAAGFVFGAFQVPQNYVGSPSFGIMWTSATVAGTIVFDVAYRAISGSDTESLDQTTQSQQVLGGTTSGPSAAHERIVTDIALTAGNFAASDTVQFEISRDPTDGNDTKADAITVHDIYFEYDDV